MSEQEEKKPCPHRLRERLLNGWKRCSHCGVLLDENLQEVSYPPR